MRFERQLDMLTGLVVLLAILTYALASRSPTVALIGIPACIAAWLLGEQFKSHALPRIAANALVLVAVLRALWVAFQRGVRVEDVCVLVVIILVIKLFDRKNARDYAQLLTLSIFLTLGSVLTSNAFLMGIVMIAMLPLIIASATVFQLYTAWEQQINVEGDTARRVTGALPGRDFWRLVSIATVGAVGVAISAFVMLPRGVGEDVLGRMRPPSTGQQTGFTDSVDLGRGGLISESTAVVLDLALFRPGSNEPIGESGLVYYLRGAVLDDYRNGHWKRTSIAGRQDTNWMTAELGEKVRLRPIPVDTPDDAKIAQRVSIRKLGEGEQHLFTLWRPFVVSFDSRTRFSRNTFDNSIRVEGRGGRFEYTTVSVVQDTNPINQTRGSVQQFTTPVGVRELASQILEDRGIDPDPTQRPIASDARAAQAIQDHLRANYDYTLDIHAAPPREDPVVWFLNDQREGHCEYFASAMALMCRSVGIDARVVTGYVAAEFNSATGHYVVRESNAHAWVEVEDAPGRWKQYDPTPPTDLDRIHRPALGVWGRFKQWFNALEYAWINSVVSYDQQPQQRLDRAERPDVSGGGTMQSLFRNIQRGGMELWFRALFFGIMVFAACAALLTIVEWAYRTLLARVATCQAHKREVQLDPDLPKRIEQMGLYSDLLRAMQRAGFAKPSYMPPAAHVASIERVAPRAGESARRVIDLFYVLRFGRRVLTPEELAEATRQVRDFEQAMRDMA